MSKKNYSKLSIDTSHLEEWLAIDCEEFFDTNYYIKRTDKNDRIQFEIISDNQTVRIDFLKCNGGLLTIYPNVGKHIDISEKIAEKIYLRSTNPLKDSPYANGFSLILDEEDFQTMIELLKVMDYVTLDDCSIFREQGKAKYDQYRFVGPQKDSVTIKYFFNTHRIQMQGKPLSLFNEVLMLLGEKIDNKEALVDAQLKYCKIDNTHEEVFEELKHLLGEELNTFLPYAHKAILSSSLVFSKVDVYTGDYSIIVSPAGRAFEGFAKKIFDKFNLCCNSLEQLGKFFEWDKSQVPEKPVMKPEYSCNLDDQVVDGLTKIYAYYSKVRHPYMHSGATSLNTTIIENSDEAKERLFDIINNMKAWMTWYNQFS